MKHNIIVAGGTAGHVYPAVLLAQNIENPIIYTDDRGKKYIPDDIPTKIISGGGVYNTSTIKKCWNVFKLGLGLATCISKFIIKRPKQIIVFGGYISLPAAFSGIILRIPIYGHEQNSVMGRANRLLLKFVKKMGISFPQTQNIPNKYHNKIVHTGLPIRPLLTPNHQINKKFTIGILGGSLGAKKFDTLIPNSINKLSKNIKVIHQTKSTRLYTCDNDCQPYFHDMNDFYNRCDFIICRSGAATIFEIIKMQKCAIFIPLPGAVDDHQTTNAKYITDQNGGILYPEHHDNLDKIIAKLIENPEIIEQHVECVKNISCPDAISELKAMIK